MEIFIEPIGKLINEFSKLPGVGKKTAQRYAYKIINGIELDESIVDPTDVEMLEDLIMAAINDGYAKADKVYEEKMGKFGNMGSLGGML